MPLVPVDKGFQMKKDFFVKLKPFLISIDLEQYIVALKL